MLFFFFKHKTAYEIRLSVVGSEMCIGGRANTGQHKATQSQNRAKTGQHGETQARTRQHRAAQANAEPEQSQNRATQSNTVQNTHIQGYTNLYRARTGREQGNTEPEPVPYTHSMLLTNIEL